MVSAWGCFLRVWVSREICRSVGVRGKVQGVCVYVCVCACVCVCLCDGVCR